jgi:hypothetical protein
MGLMSPPRAPSLIANLQANVVRAARQVAACALVEEVADVLGVSTDDVWTAMSTLPDSMLDLLDSPDGWVELADIAAIELGLAAVDYAPQVH